MENRVEKWNSNSVGEPNRTSNPTTLTLTDGCCNSHTATKRNSESCSANSNHAAIACTCVSNAGDFTKHRNDLHCSSCGNRVPDGTSVHKITEFNENFASSAPALEHLCDAGAKEDSSPSNDDSTSDSVCTQIRCGSPAEQFEYSSRNEPHKFGASNAGGRIRRSSNNCNSPARLEDFDDVTVELRDVSVTDAGTLECGDTDRNTMPITSYRFHRGAARGSDRPVFITGDDHDRDLDFARRASYNQEFNQGADYYDTADARNMSGQQEESTLLLRHRERDDVCGKDDDEDDDDEERDREEEHLCRGIPHNSSETEVKRALPSDDEATDSGSIRRRHCETRVQGCVTSVNQCGAETGALSQTQNGLCPPGLEHLLDTSQLVVHMGNLRHDIFFNVRSEKRMEVVDEMRRLMYYVEQEPIEVLDGNRSFLFKFYDRNKQEVMQVYNPGSRTCLACGLTWHWFNVCNVQAVVYSPLGVIAGFIRRAHTFLVQEFHILAPNETVLLRLRGSLSDLEIFSVDLQHGVGRLSVHGWVGVMHEIRRTSRDYGLTSSSACINLLLGDSCSCFKRQKLEPVKRIERVQDSLQVNVSAYCSRVSHWHVVYKPDDIPEFLACLLQQLLFSDTATELFYRTTT